MVKRISKEELVERLEIAQALLEQFGLTASLNEPGFTPLEAVGLAAVPADYRIRVAAELSQSYNGNKGILYVSEATQDCLRSVGVRKLDEYRDEVKAALDRILDGPRAGLQSDRPGLLEDTLAAVLSSRKS
ncbi:MAG TPA: hypothetical protein VFH06_02405 [Candidatus Saccharimonadales bacterium]|nr:hypothetical protein [Candidatus Saccharimonadales bacterium]